MNNSKRFNIWNRWLLITLSQLCAFHLSATLYMDNNPNNTKGFSYTRSDNTTGYAFATDSLILDKYKFYIAKDYRSSLYGLIMGKLGTYYQLLPIDSKNIKFTSTIRYCYLKNKNRCYFYDIVNNNLINADFSYNNKLIEGTSNDHGSFVSDGKLVLFEDGYQITAPSDNYKIVSNGASQIEVKIFQQNYLMDGADISSVWRVNSFIPMEDSIVGSYIISSFLSDSILVANSPNEEESILLHCNEEYYDTLKIRYYPSVRPISNTDQYMLGAISDSIYYIYDWINDQQYQLKDVGDYRYFDDIVYLGERNNESIFLIDKYWLLGINGFQCHLECGLEIDPEKCEVDGNIYIKYDESIGTYVKLTDFLDNKVLISIFDPKDKFCENLRLKEPNSSEEDLSSEAGFSLYIPKLKYEKGLKQHILYWISECIFFSSGYKEMFVPSVHTTEYNLFDYYKRLFISGFYKDESEFKWGGFEGVNVEKIFETNNFVSFIYGYDNNLGGGTGYGYSYATTFDKKKNRRLNLNDIVASEARPIIEDYLRSVLYREVDDSLINTCVALGTEGINFVYGRYKISGNWTETLIVPYSLIKQWLLVPYDINDSKVGEIKLEFVDSYNCDEEYEKSHVSLNLTPELKKNNPVNWYYNARRDEPIELKINGGYNRKNALRLMEVAPLESIKIIKWLACEQGTSFNSQVYDELLKMAKISLARKHIRNNDLVAAKKCLEEIISSEKLDNSLIAEDGKYYYVDALMEMCNIANIEQDKSLLTDCQSKISESLPTHIQNYFSRLSRDNRSKLWNFYRGWFFSDIHTAAFTTKDSTLLKAAYNALLFGKGLLLNTEIAFRKHILNSGNIELYNLLSEYDKLKERKRALERRKDKDALNEIEDRIDEVESQLISETEYSDYLSSQSIDLSQLSSCLHENEIAVEFVDVQEKSDTIYYALLMRKGYTAPIMKRVFSCSQFNEICKERKNIYELYNLIWRPLEKEITDCNTIYFSPGGKLYTIPIEYAIVDSTKGINICDEYKIFRLSSTREIVLARDTTYNRAITAGMSLLIGGLDYNVSTNTEKIPNETIISSAALRGSLSRKSRVRNLPGTKEEVLGIAPYVRNLNHTYPVVILTDSLGTEHNFRKSVNSHVSNMHIATHGFYLTDKDFSQLDRDNYFSQIGRNIRDIEENSLVRSGLMLAGVNVALQGKKIVSDDNDGLLTTLEISTLDFNDIDLTVLSACDTGEGDVSTEGVFGLQRGFKKAGAKSLLLSLWPVNDDATKILMVKFYEQLSITHDKRLSLKTAQEHLRKYNNGEYSNPLYWAAFILLDGL